MAAPLDPLPNTPENYTVGFEGFSDFERAAIASYFRLTFTRTRSYRQAASSTSDFLVADADSAPAVQAVLRDQRIRDTVFIGARVPPSALAWLPRPIDPKQIVRELDSLVELRNAPHQEDFNYGQAAGNDLGALALKLPEHDTSFHNTTAAGLSAAESDSDTSPGNSPLLEAQAQAQELQPELQPEPPQREKPRRPQSPMRDVLVVEDSAIARKFLVRRLELLGYRVHTADNGEEALYSIKQRPYAIVFLDVMLGAAGSIDGWHLCQVLRKRGTDDPSQRCAIVMVTSLAAQTDRVRGSFAGCDAYLTKPLIESDFIAALRRVDPAFQLERPPHASS